MAEAIAAVHTLEHTVNALAAKGELESEGAAVILDCFRDFDRILAVFDVDAETKSGTEVPDEVKALAEERSAAKKAKDFRKADEIRDRLKELGWSIKDTPNGPELTHL